jgi:drug/metabolite transporter (DMT)-like permease
VAAGEAWPAQIPFAGWAGLGFQTVIVCFASYLLWFWLIRHYPATRLAAFTLLTPLLGLLAGVLLLDEPLTLRLMVAGAGGGNRHCAGQPAPLTAAAALS